VVAFLFGGLTLPGCQEMGDDRAAASFDPGPAAEPEAGAGYPPLQSVPPRPQLSYSVQQQRQIVEALIADRENARYTQQVVRHRSGLSSLPPPPTPPEPARPVSFEPAIATPAPEPSLTQQESFVDFIAALFSDGEPDAEPAAAERDVSELPQMPVAPEETPARPDCGEPASRVDAVSTPIPLPPARTAVAVRAAAGPDVIDSLVDPAVPQAPLPSGQPALAARLAAADQIEAPPGHVPVLRPDVTLSADAAPPAPPPVKPIVPTDAPLPPTPAEKPADYRSAAAAGSWPPEITSAASFAGSEAVVVAQTSP
jgi:hypothetical protein